MSEQERVTELENQVAALQERITALEAALETSARRATAYNFSLLAALETKGIVDEKFKFHLDRVLGEMFKLMADES